MTVTKKIIGSLNKCYSIAPLHYRNQDWFLVAAEKQDPCYLFDLDGNPVEKIWDGPGGVMSMVQIPGTDGQFLATFEFYSPNDSKEARIVLVSPEENGQWSTRTLARLPHVHRFDLLKSGNSLYLIACTLKSDHQFKDDWSCPGKVYAAEFPRDLSEIDEAHPLKLTVLKDNMLKNHGYCRSTEGGDDTAVISCNTGVYQFVPPKFSDGQWEIRTLSILPTSDAAFVDFEGNGNKALCTLSPFHGDQVSIYRRNGAACEKLYDYPEKAEFSHAICGCTLCGQPAFVFGHRKGKRRLVAVTWNKIREAFEETVLDTDCGPANVCHYVHEGKDIIIAANREINEIAMYTITEK